MPRLRDTVERSHDHRLAGWREDLRLFALTWAAGFVFWLILIG